VEPSSITDSKQACFAGIAAFIHKATLGILHLGEKIEGEIIKI
jgi:hypothetical protein